LSRIGNSFLATGKPRTVSLAARVPNRGQNVNIEDVAKTEVYYLSANHTVRGAPSIESSHQSMQRVYFVVVSFAISSYEILVQPSRKRSVAHVLAIVVPPYRNVDI
jgi:hypothetical protein